MRVVAETVVTLSVVVPGVPDNFAKVRFTNGATNLETIGVLMTPNVLPAYAVLTYRVVPATLIVDAVRAGRDDRGPLDNKPTAVRAAAERDGVENADSWAAVNVFKGETGSKTIPTSFVDSVRTVTPLEVRVVPIRFGYPVFLAERREVWKV